MVHNMLNDPKIETKLVKTDDLKFSTLRFNEETIKIAFKLLLENVLMCCRVLKDPQNINKKKTAYQFLFSRTNSLLNENQSPEKNCQLAMTCLQSIVSYFPEIHKMKKFLAKFDMLIKQQQAENKHKVTELQKQMRVNKVMMKICVDIELSVLELQ